MANAKPADKAILVVTCGCGTQVRLAENTSRPGLRCPACEKVLALPPASPPAALRPAPEDTVESAVPTTGDKRNARDEPLRFPVEPQPAEPPLQVSASVAPDAGTDTREKSTPKGPQDSDALVHAAQNVASCANDHLAAKPLTSAEATGIAPARDEPGAARARSGLPIACWLVAVLGAVLLVCSPYSDVLRGDWGFMAGTLIVCFFVLLIVGLIGYGLGAVLSRRARAVSFCVAVSLAVIVSYIGIARISARRSNHLHKSTPGNAGEVASPPAARSATVTVKWPTAFTQTTEQALSIEANTPRLILPVLLEKTALVYGACLVQQESIRRLQRDFPALRQQLGAAAADFNLRLGPAVQNAEKCLAAALGDKWNEVNQQVLLRAEESVGKMTVTLAEAEAFVRDLRHRTGAPSSFPPLQPVLMFHPDYIRQPADEFSRGHKQEYRTDGSGKAAGIKLAIQFPESWVSKEGRRPHMVRNLQSGCGHGLVFCNILVKPVPEVAAHEVLSADDIEEPLSFFEDELKSMGASAKSKVIDWGRAKLANQPVLWGESVIDVEMAGVSATMHQIQFVMYHKSRLIVLTFAASQYPDEPVGAASRRMQHYGPLIQLIVASFELMDRFE